MSRQFTTEGDAKSFRITLDDSSKDHNKPRADSASADFAYNTHEFANGRLDVSRQGGRLVIVFRATKAEPETPQETASPSTEQSTLPETSPKQVPAKPDIAEERKPRRRRVSTLPDAPGQLRISEVTSDAAATTSDGHKAAPVEKKSIAPTTAQVAVAIPAVPSHSTPLRPLTLEHEARVTPELPLRVAEILYNALAHAIGIFPRAQSYDEEHGRRKVVGCGDNPTSAVKNARGKASDAQIDREYLGQAFSPAEREAAANIETHGPPWPTSAPPEVKAELARRNSTQRQS